MFNYMLKLVRPIRTEYPNLALKPSHQDMLKPFPESLCFMFFMREPHLYRV